MAAQRNATTPSGDRPRADPAEPPNELIEVYKKSAQSFIGQRRCAHCGEPIDPRNYIEQGDRVFHPTCIDARWREGKI